MIMHTIVPPEILWEGQQDIQPSVTISCGGVLAEAQCIAPGQFRVLRLLDGRCGHYLHPRLQPGQVWRQ